MKTDMKMKTKWSWLGGGRLCLLPALCIWLSILLAACVAPITQSESSNSDTDPDRVENPIRLKVQTLPYLSFAPYFIAQEEGYFAEAGLDIEFVRFQRSADAIPALLQGEIDVLGGAFSFGLINAMTQDAGLRIVAEKGNMGGRESCSTTSLVAGPHVDLDELDNRETMTDIRLVGNMASFQGFLIEEMLARYELTPADVTMLDLPTAATLDALDSGAVDLAMLIEPAITQAVTGGYGVEWLKGNELAPDYQSGLIVYGPNLLTGDPELGERFLVAYLKGLQRYNEGKTARNLEILAQHTELDIDLLEAACWPAFRGDGVLEAHYLTTFQEWGVTQGLLDRVVDSESLIERRYVDYANQVLGSP